MTMMTDEEFTAEEEEEFERAAKFFENFEPTGPPRDASGFRAVAEARVLADTAAKLADQVAAAAAATVAASAAAHVYAVVQNARVCGREWGWIASSLRMSIDAAREKFEQADPPDKAIDLRAIAEAAKLAKAAAELAERYSGDLVAEVAGRAHVHLGTLVQSAHLQHDRSWDLIGETLGTSGKEAEDEFRPRFYQVWLPDGRIVGPDNWEAALADPSTDDV